MSEAAQAETPKLSRTTILRLTRKSVRKLDFAPGNRHACTNAKAWYACLRRDDQAFEYILARHARLSPRRAAEAQRNRRKILRDFQQKERTCQQIASGLLQQARFRVHPRYRQHALDVLTGILLLAHNSGVLYACYRTVARYARLSETATKRWIVRLEVCGILIDDGLECHGPGLNRSERLWIRYTRRFLIPHLLQGVTIHAYTEEAERKPSVDAPSSRELAYLLAALATGSRTKKRQRRWSGMQQLLYDHPKPGEWYFDRVVAAHKHENPYGLKPRNLGHTQADIEQRRVTP